MSISAKQRGLFITIEGIEGVGKSTNLAFVKDYLEKACIPLVVTREPGGTPIAESIRQVLLAQYPETMAAETELLLMFASRVQHIATVIRPALAAGKWVLCDRFTDATYAYQGGGRGISVERIGLLEEWLQSGLNPDLTLLLDAPVKLALSRAKKRSLPDRFEQEKEAFFIRIRDCYLSRAKQYPERYRIVDATQPLVTVQKQIAIVLQPLL